MRELDRRESEEERPGGIESEKIWRVLMCPVKMTHNIILFSVGHCTK